MPTDLSAAVITPDEFFRQIAFIIATKREHAAHRAMDMLTSNVLRSLGYGEGAALFETAVGEWHSEKAPYPRPLLFNWRCFFGFHNWVGDDPNGSGWIGVWSETCAKCGARNGSGNPCP